MAATVWRGNLGFGLVSIPVRLYRAARPERVRFRQMRRAAPPAEQDARPGSDQVIRFPAPAREREAEQEAPALSRVTRPAFDRSEDAPVPPTELVRAYEAGKDRYVVMEDKELRDLAARTSRDMEIREFVRFAEIDPLYLETSYFVAPAPGGDHAYGMLFAALRSTGYAALAEMAMHRREHVVVVRPGQRGLIAHTMFYSDEVHLDEEHSAAPSLVSGKELELAELFVRSLAATFEPAKYRDRYRERVEALLAGKIGAGELVDAEAPPPAAAPSAPDILEALRRSLEAIRKPPASETAKPAKQRPRKGRGSPG
ncbi:MAG TPA: Ku protein [Bryobacteraceae bacterium]|nr:Ku protein [Bryobacteraceae bacterium]